MRRGLLILVVLLCLGAACGDDSGSDDAARETESSTTSTQAPTEPATTAPGVTTPDYTAEIADLPAAPDDRSLPDIAPDGPVGAYGFSRYVYQRQGDDIVPTLIEGPQGFQTRCQDLEQDCSYLELKELYESGADIPGYLDMDRETLGTLVDQLGRVEAAIARYPTLDDACAAGMTISSAQNANMGIHVYDFGAGARFNPDRPQMILFAKEGGELIPRLEIGQCVDGAFTGEDGFRPVGAVFNIEFTEDHPEGFAGGLDNWHVHLNTCAGGSIENADQIDPEVEGAISATREQCEASGGRYMEVIPSWMMHAYAVPDFDAQGGVFSMFNPSVWPLVGDSADIRDRRTPSTTNAIAAPIVNFDFGEVAVDVGETVRFANADSVPHTVTAGSALSPDPAGFDSGLLGTGDAFEVAFDEAGTYELFCVLHPDMTATVTVG